jgi:hypothetical protein
MEAISGRIAARLELLRKRGSPAIMRTALEDELLRGLRVTALRARHRALTIRALIAKRREYQATPELRESPERLLAAAGSVRREALALVRRQELQYRYPPELLARRRASLTAYPFGYLYPVASLFFWEREEEQVRRERFDPFFMKLWDARRTLGLESLLFR